MLNKTFNSEFEMENTAIFLRARLGSSRLPKKHLLKLKGKPAIQHLIERIKANTQIKNIVLCTTTDKEDDKLEDIANECKINCFRGHAESVLKRYYDAGKKYGVKSIVNVDCDDLLLDFSLIDRTGVLMQLMPEVDYLTWEGYPLGCVPSGMSYSGITKLYDRYPEDVEHVFMYFEKYEEINKIHLHVINKTLSKEYVKDIRLTLDYMDDFKLFEIIYNNIYNKDEYIIFDTLMAFLDKNQDLLKINNYLNEAFIKHQQSAITEIKNNKT